MADQDGCSPRLDRVARPTPGSRRRDVEGKEALYSTAPTAAPTTPLQVTCRRCGVTSGLTVTEALRLLAPPMLANPLTGTMWTRCPACDRRSWLDGSPGQALRALLGRGTAGRP